MALEKLDGVSGAYVNKNIALHFDKEGDLDEELIASTIEPFKMKVKSSKKLNDLPF